MSKYDEQALKNAQKMQNSAKKTLKKAKQKIPQNTAGNGTKTTKQTTKIPTRNGGSNASRRTTNTSSKSRKKREIESVKDIRETRSKNVDTAAKAVKTAAGEAKDYVKREGSWTLREVKADLKGGKEGAAENQKIRKERQDYYKSIGGVHGDKIGQFYTGLGMGLLDNTIGIPYSIVTGKKLSDSELMGGEKFKEEYSPNERGATARNVGEAAGIIGSYAIPYGAAGKVTSKAAGKVLSTTAGKKIMSKAAEEGSEELVKAAVKDAIADATVGTTMNLGIARGQGLEGKELKSDMEKNALLDFAIGGVMDTVPMALKALNNSQVAKQATEAVTDAAKGAKTATKTASEIPYNNTGTSAKAQSAQIGSKTSYVPAENVDDAYKNVYNDYINSVDEDTKTFVEKAKNGNINKKATKKLGEVSQEEADRIKELTGIDTTGYQRTLPANSVEHIEKRHGASGAADKSMSDVNDVARINYVLDNFDDIELLKNGDGTIAKTGALQSSSQKAAQMIRYKKRIDGYYYVVEAVAENSKKQLRVVTAYIEKAGNNMPAGRPTSPVHGTNTAPQVTSKTPNAVSASGEASLLTTSQPKIGETYYQPADTLPTESINNSEASVKPQNASGVQVMTKTEPQGIPYNTAKSAAGTETPQRIPYNTTNKTTPTAKLTPKAQQRIFDAVEKRSGTKIVYADLPDGIDGTYQNGVITISNKAQNPVYTVLKHELTHHIETSGYYAELSDFIQKTMREAGYDVDQSISDIISDYARQGKNLTNEEAQKEFVAKFAGEYLFNSEKSIERLARENPNVFQRVYDWIVDTIKKIGADDETKFLIDAQRKYEKTLRTVGKTQDNGIQYSLRQFTDGTRFVKVDADTSAFDGLSRREQGKLATKIIKEKYAGKVVGADNPIFVNGRGAGEFGFPIKKLGDSEHSAKMRSSTELDNLFDAGSNYRNMPDGADGHIHENVTGGFDYYDVIFEVGDRYYKGKINVMNTKNGKLFKDITKIEDITEDISSSYGKNPKSTFLRTSSTDNIPESQEAVNRKNAQFRIIQNTNKMTDNYHTGIRDASEIKTFEEAMEDSESFVYGDFSKTDAEEALRKGEVTVYSSKPIEQGGFVSTSKNMAEDYAGGGKVYSQRVKLDDVAWINGDEGQYAKVKQNIPLESRVQGDDLLNAEYTIDMVRSVGGNVDENGYVTLYHRTSKENAEKIRSTGKMSAKEDGVFFSTSKSGYNDGYGDTVVEFKVPAEKIELDDIFGDEAHFRIPLEGKNRTLDVSEYLDNSANAGAKLSSGNNLAETDYTARLRQASEKLYGENGNKYLQIPQANAAAKTVPETIPMATKATQTETQQTLPYNTAKTRKVASEPPDSMSDEKWEYLMGANKRTANETSEEAWARVLNEADERYKDKHGLNDEQFKAFFSDPTTSTKETKKGQWYEHRQAKNAYKEIGAAIGIDKNSNKAYIKEEIDAAAEKMRNGSLSKAERDGLFENILSGTGKEMSVEEKAAARVQFDSALDTLENEMNIVKRYTERRSSDITVDQMDSLISSLGKLKRDAEKTKSKIVLSSEDRTLVDQLLKGNITPEKVRAININAHNIIEVYNAEKPVYEIKKALKKVGDETKQGYRDVADDFLTGSENWKDKIGFSYARETPERNFVDVAGKEAGERINSEFITPIHEHEASATRMKNDLRDEVKSLNLSSDAKYSLEDVLIDAPGLDQGSKVSEETLVQLFGEGLIKKEDLVRIGADADKIEAAAKTMRGIYNQLIEKANNELIRHGCEPIEFRKDYFPHFSEDKPDSMLAKIGHYLGIDVAKDELPTDIAGLTHTFRPGKKWFGNALQRTGKATEYNAVKGFDLYIEGISDVIYHTEDIQKLRALESEIRFKYSDDGIKKRVKEVRESDAPDTVKESLIEKIYEEGNTKLGGMATWLRNYTDQLAGKKSQFDRVFEQGLGRGIYNTTKALENRVAANMVALNPGSWLTNFIPLVQAGEISPKYVIEGMAQTIGNRFRKVDDIADISTFLTNRKGSDTLWKTNIEKIQNVLTSPMQMIDNFTSEALVRAKYAEGIKKGLNEVDAIDAADKFAADIIADRSKGALPTMFNSKNPISKIFTMYQVEVNNQWSHLMKDIPRSKENVAQVALAFTNFALGAYIFNDVYERLVGRRTALDPISWVNDFVGDTTGKKLPNFTEALEDAMNGEGISLEETDKKSGGGAVTSLGENVAQDIPFIGGLLEGGRVPISSALPSFSTLATTTGNLISGDTDTKKGLMSIGKELSKPATYILPPVGGGQIKKAVEATRAFANGGVYGLDKDGNQQLKFATDTTPSEVAKGLLFGQYAIGNSDDYVSSGFNMLSVNKTQAYQALVESGMKNTKAEDFVRSLPSKKTEMREAIMNSNLTAKQKNAVGQVLDEKSPDYTNQATFAYSQMSDSKQKVVNTLKKSGMTQSKASAIYDVQNKYSSQTEKVNALLEEGYKDAVFEALGLGEKGIAAGKALHKAGVTNLTYQSSKKSADTNNSGNVSIEEAEKYLDKKSYSRAEKYALMKALTGCADKNNKYYR